MEPDSNRNNGLEIFLDSTSFIDSDSTTILDISKDIQSQSTSQRECAVNLFYWARDEIKYNPYSPFFAASDYQASTILKSILSIALD